MASAGREEGKEKEDKDKDKDKDKEGKAGLVLRKYIRKSSMDALLDDVDMLKFLFPHHIHQLTPPEQAIALTHLFLTGSSDNIVRYLLEHITADTLNGLIECGKYQGASMVSSCVMSLVE